MKKETNSSNVPHTDEAEFLKNYSTENYPRPSLTADVVIFAREENKKYVLLIKRGNHPFRGAYAFPGGFADPNETIEQTALRELFEETGIKNADLTPIDMFTKPLRDPRGWVVTYAYLACVDKSAVLPIAGDDAAEALWFELSYDSGTFKLTYENTKIEFYIKGESTIYTTVDKLAFDHAEILNKAYALLKS